LASGEHILGRSSDAGVFIADAGVSRHHARITIGEHGATLEDLGSKNGTMLNGRTIDGPTLLVDGTVILLGSTTLKFRTFATPGSTETLGIV
jgi:pSer/pThr/pTyr-binding forkhead associated (FHA) protein